MEEIRGNDMYKLIVTDLDSTLLRSDKTISERTSAALCAVREKGVFVVFATARSEKASERAAHIIKPDFRITCGGALTMDSNGGVLKKLLLPPEIAGEVIAFCKTLPSVGRISEETGDGHYFVDSEHWMYDSGDYAHAELFDFSKPPDCEAYKLVIQIPDRSDRAALKQHFPGLTIHGYSDSPGVFIAAPGVGKWDGVKAVIEKLGITPSEVVAFGDDENDIEMLKNSGMGVAMENGSPEAKAAVNQICGHCDNDGLAVWIENNLL